MNVEFLKENFEPLTIAEARTMFGDPDGIRTRVTLAHLKYAILLVNTI